MASRRISNWTFCGLVGAFLDLALAYCLLCGATFAFFAAKFLGVFGLHLPCPCGGLFGHPNGQCLHGLLVDRPPQRVSSVLTSVRNSFPFESVLAEEDGISIQSGSKFAREDEAPSRRLMAKAGEETESSRSENSNSSNGDCDHPKPPRGSRRRRDQKNSDITDRRDGDLSGSGSGLEDDDDDEVRVLKKALEQERASRSLLHLELEKERSAAATAAEEAMAMILRLQKEKAEIEMKARQYQRMAEEKDAYDEEELNILNQIIFRREMEKHVLLKENELYRQIILSGEGIEPKKLDDLPWSFHGASMEQEERESGSTGRKREKVLGTMEERESDSIGKKREKVLGMMEERESDSTRRKREKVLGTMEERESDSIGRKREKVLGTMEGRESDGSNSDRQRFILEAEMEFLREKLEAVQRGRERLNLSLDYDDKENFQLQQLLEEISAHLREIRRLAEPRKPTWQSDVAEKTTLQRKTKKRRGQSVAL